MSFFPLMLSIFAIAYLLSVYCTISGYRVLYGNGFPWFLLIETLWAKPYTNFLVRAAKEALLSVALAALAYYLGWMTWFWALALTILFITIGGDFFKYRRGSPGPRYQGNPLTKAR